MTEIVEVFRTAGEFDYLLRVVVTDMTVNPGAKWASFPER
jgi:hypothetical protein